MCDVGGNVAQLPVGGLARDRDVAAAPGLRLLDDAVRFALQQAAMLFPCLQVVRGVGAFGARCALRGAQCGLLGVLAGGDR